MEPIELSPRSSLVIATDPLEIAKELQTNLATLDPNLQQQFAVEAIEILGDPRELHGSNRVVIHTLGAMVLMHCHPTKSSITGLTLLMQ